MSNINTQSAQSTSKVATLKFWSATVQKNGSTEIYPRVLASLVNGPVNALLTSKNSAVFVSKEGNNLPLGAELACGNTVTVPVISHSTVSLNIPKALLEQLKAALLDHKVVVVEVPIEKDSYPVLTATPYSDAGLYHIFSVSLGHVEEFISIKAWESTKEYESNVIPTSFKIDYPEVYIFMHQAIKSNDERAQLARYKAKTLSVPTPNTEVVLEEEEIPVF